MVRVLDSRPRGRGFEPHQCHCVVSLSKTHLSLLTLTPAYLYCKFAFCAHFQCVLCTYDLKCFENVNQVVKQSKIMNIHMRWGALVR